MKFSWNDTVVLHPNTKGWSVWMDYYRVHGLSAPVCPTFPHTLETQLWIAAQVFGPKISQSDMLFVDTSIKIKALL